MKKKKRRIKVGNLLILIAGVLLLAIAVAGGVLYFINKDKTVYVVEIDAAHGGDNSGYQGLLNEDEYNEAVMNELYVLLENDASFEVLRTHEPGVAASVTQRSAKINEEKPDLVLSVRCYNNDGEHSGTEIYTKPASMKQSSDSRKFAELLNQELDDSSIKYMYYNPFKQGRYQEMVVDYEDTTDYGMETFPLLEQTTVPTVIVAQLNVDNEDMVNKYNTEDAIKEVANQYYRAIRGYFGL